MQRQNRVQAVEQAGTTDVDAVRQAMYGQTVPNLTGGEAVMKSTEHRSGTDRVAEVAPTLVKGSIIVNVQGDEPVISPDTNDAAVQELIEAFRAARPDVPDAELVHRLDRETSGCLLVAKRRAALRCGGATLDLDGTAVECYGVKKEGIAYSYQGARAGRPPVATWAEAGLVPAADRLAGGDDPRPRSVLLQHQSVRFGVTPRPWGVPAAPSASIRAMTASGMCTPGTCSRKAT